MNSGSGTPLSMSSPTNCHGSAAGNKPRITGTWGSCSVYRSFHGTLTPLYLHFLTSHFFLPALVKRGSLISLSALYYYHYFKLGYSHLAAGCYFVFRDLQERARHKTESIMDLPELENLSLLL